MSTFTKNELAADLAVKTDMTLGQAHAVIDHIFSAIQTALIGGRKVEFRGFGSFSPKIRPGRNGRNPMAPAGSPPIQIPPKNVIRFKVGSQLRAALNGVPIIVSDPPAV